MSLSLATSDFEITPVQAWFLLVEKYDVRKVVEERRMEALKRGLGGLVGCWAFGAVMDRERFWRVVEEVMSG